MNETIQTIWPIGPVTSDAATALSHRYAFMVRIPALGSMETLHLVGYGQHGARPRNHLAAKG